MKTHLNLLPLEVQRWQIVRLRLGPWCVIWSAVALLWVTLAALDWQESQAASRKLKAIEEQLAPTRTLAETNRQLAAQIEALEKRESVALTLSNERPSLALLGMIARASQAAAGRVYVQQLQWNEAPPALGDATSVAPRAGLRLEGVGADNLSIARFAAALRDTDVFSQVSVHASNAAGEADESGRSYAIECAF
jgi:hypothetical protein